MCARGIAWAQGQLVELATTIVRRSSEENLVTKIAVIYYSSTGNVHQLAEAVAEGAREAGAEVRLRRVPELAPQEAIDSNPMWRAHVDATADQVEEATPEDLEWADGYALGT